MPPRRRGSPRRARQQPPVTPAVPRWLQTYTGAGSAFGGSTHAAGAPVPTAYYGGQVRRGQPSIYLPTILRDRGGPTPTVTHGPVDPAVQRALQQATGPYTPGNPPVRNAGLGVQIGIPGTGQQWNVNPELAYTPPNMPTTTADTGGGGGGGSRYVPAPAGLDPVWYRQFQDEHGGQTPEEYYAQTGEDIGHALADEEWARGFAEMYGRPPTEDDWRYHWFQTRVGHQPGRGGRGAQGGGNNEERPPTYMPPMIIWR